MPKDLTLVESGDLCALLGIKLAGRKMDNGELRFKVSAPSGAAYILTAMADEQDGAWQNAHYHGGKLLSPGEPSLKIGITELILVESGWVASADLMPNGEHEIKLCKPGDVWISRPGIAHNIYQRGVTHCLKYGVPVGNHDEQRKGDDWWPAPKDFNDWTKSLSEDDIHRLAAA